MSVGPIDVRGSYRCLWEAGPDIPWDLAELITSGTALLQSVGLCAMIAGGAGGEARFAFLLLALATTK